MIFFKIRTRPEILTSKPPRRFGSATAQTKALIHTTRKNITKKQYEVPIKSCRNSKKSPKQSVLLPGINSSLEKNANFAVRVSGVG